ncbi:DUF3267 domain-containing protein [Virgibacillus sp. LDC-1]|uniref:DUF3267 domain-containing protein n=1 Tax=Virgibacillus sp. LDC-1 TaxID=3039856 RepID=UPI0024DEE1A2|nr:DUF3267 domain-containing protein [Virgibacillus sp. LDC-1]
MNCWKSINFNKEFGMKRLYFMSFLIGLIAFILLYVPASIAHDGHHAKESGMFAFMVALVMLPSLHSFMHVIPILAINKRARLKYKTRSKLFPIFTYYTDSHLTKKVSLIVALAPTFFITMPGIFASYIFPNYYAYILLFTCTNIGISFVDFLYVSHIIRAPKKSFIESGNDGFDILLEANNSPHTPSPSYELD